MLVFLRVEEGPAPLGKECHLADVDVFDWFTLKLGLQNQLLKNSAKWIQLLLQEGSTAAQVKELC